MDEFDAEYLRESGQTEAKCRGETRKKLKAECGEIAELIARLETGMAKLESPKRQPEFKKAIAKLRAELSTLIREAAADKSICPDWIGNAMSRITAIELGTMLLEMHGLTDTINQLFDGTLRVASEPHNPAYPDIVPGATVCQAENIGVVVGFKRGRALVQWADIGFLEEVHPGSLEIAQHLNDAEERDE
jgi:hypothetical protein